MTIDRGYFERKASEDRYDLRLLLDELEAKDRRIAELEIELTATTEQSDSWRTQAQQLTAQISMARDMNRHYEQERDSWPKAYQQRAQKTDARIAELEAGLREALEWHRPKPFEDLCKIQGGHATELVSRDVRIGTEHLEDALDRLRKLLPSEEK